MEAFLDPLLSTFQAAELTTCVLLRLDRNQSDPDSAVSAFATLIFKATAPNLPRFAYLTPRRLNAPGGGRHALVIARSILTRDEAMPIARFDGQFADPCHPDGYRPIQAPGEWVDSIFVGQDGHAARWYLPFVDSSFWLREHWQPSRSLQAELGPRSLPWLEEAVRSTLGVNFALRPDRIGNVLVVLPETRIRMRLRYARSKPSLGVEIRSSDAAPERLTLCFRSLRDGHVDHSALHSIRPGLQVVPIPAVVVERQIELFDAATGTLLDRQGGVVLRSFDITGHLVTAQLDLTVNILGPDGAPHGAPISVRTNWSSTVRTIAGGQEAWEVAQREASLRAQRELLREQKRLLVYRGGPDERTRAVEDVRELIHSRARTYLKIWDPYFGGRDALEFLFYVADPSMRVSLLTAVRSTPHEEELLRTFRNSVGTPESPQGAKALKQSARDWKIEQLRRALGMLRNPKPDVQGLTALSCRTGGSYFHDRFIITEDTCWQLGCSLNQIGSVLSTIVEFPYPEIIEQEFDQAWEAAGALSSS